MCSAEEEGTTRLVATIPRISSSSSSRLEKVGEFFGKMFEELRWKLLGIWILEVGWLLNKEGVN
jgi:hypothetical protein